MSEKEKDTLKASSSEKSSKPGIFQRIGKFFKEYRGELKKISWPTMAEVIKNTMITLAAVLIVGVVIWVFDYAVTTLRDMVIAIDKDTVSASDVVEDEEVKEEVSDIVASVSDVVEEIVSGAEVTEG